MSGPEILGSSGGVDFQPRTSKQPRELSLCSSSLAASSLSTSRPQIRVGNNGSFASPLPRNAVYLTSIFVSAFAFEIAFDSTSNKIWDTLNQGRQWKDIRHQYIQAAEEDEE
ncbi:uncharacterized protein TRUGW13939_06493 [Talaromyces rugulosus]|uniref:Complex III subunit 9 n=1 Tax=Talaromyces rugulosus TaxID=121627 RepID=A0A7H8QZ34_TALRU|nr:uncharacterized protein TRUGW13939_06493 [Talaromyces rugulosus]QKX59359.1 hypothetical protein TRUGW13939_06493 [Talaromyces rugulosus]